MAFDGKTTGASVDTQRRVEQFLYAQAEILDDKRWEDWLRLFTEDGIYWMPASPEQETGDGVPNIFYEDVNIMKIRINRVTHPRAHSQRPPTQTSHLVSNVIIENEDARSGDVIARSRFYVSEYRNDVLRHFAGRYRHDLKRTEEGYRIRQQRVDLVNAEGPWEYVLQYWL